MTFEEFNETLALGKHPKNISRVLESLWEDRRGHWGRAHELAQEEDNISGAHVHAYLHRKEGDIANAEYWYNRARTTKPSISLDQEWELLVREFL